MGSRRYVLAIDQGTTGTTVLVVDATRPAAMRVVGRRTVDFQQHYPKTGWVEHDLEEIWQSVGMAAAGARHAAREADGDFAEAKIAALGITNQRETLCIFDRRTGRPLAPGIVWQCKRSLGIVQRLRAEGAEELVRRKTGLVLDPYFSGTKITWVMENMPDVAARLRAGDAVLGTIDTYLIARLTGGAAFATEASNASRTLIYDIHRGAWDADLMELMRVPGATVLPKIQDSASEFGRTKGCGFLPDGVPITGVLGDQQAALAGQACFSPGEAKCTYGTGAFLLANLGPRPLPSKSGMLTTVAWQLKGQRTYAFEGSAFIAGAAVQFLRDQMGLVESAAVTESLAREAVGAPEVYFVPALSGLGAPWWDPKAQGAFFGLTRGTTKAQFVRAVLEGIAFEVADITRTMGEELGASLSVLRVDGGAAANNLLMEAQAEYSKLTVDRPRNLETTAFGAALFAGLGAGIFASLDEVKSARQSERVFVPSGDDGARAGKLAGWERAVRATRVFAGTVG